MKYIKDTERLLNLVEILKVHEVDVEKYNYSHLAPKLRGIQNTKDKLAVLFATANSQRRGRSKEESGVMSATAGFYQGVDQNITQSMSIPTPKEAHLEFLTWLCNIPGVDQKTANLFLKWVVRFQHGLQIGSMNWQSWQYHLHVPLDRWVVRLMSKKYLNLCSEDYERDFLREKDEVRGANLKLTKEQYKSLQQELGEAVMESSEPRIVLDNLWFVGAFYCNCYPIMCDSCWIENECNNGKSQPDWRTKVTKTKDQLKKQRRDERKKREDQYREWMKQHPEEVAEIVRKHSPSRLVDG